MTAVRAAWVHAVVRFDLSHGKVTIAAIQAYALKHPDLTREEASDVASQDTNTSGSQELPNLYA